MPAFTIVNALGRGVSASTEGLRTNQGGLRACDFEDAELNTYIGRVTGIEDEPVVEKLGQFECRNNRLAQLALNTEHFSDSVEEARSRYGCDRIGVFIGTSTSGILQTEHAYQQRDPDTGRLPDSLLYRYTHNTFSVGDFTRQYLGLTGPAMVISTACSSSAKVFATASRYIKAGLCDAAVVGGVDSLCMTTLYGFSSLDLIASQPCQPWSEKRSGINIGEAAGFALLEPLEMTQSKVALLGWGESSDAYHMSAPHPEGAGAIGAMQSALVAADLKPGDINYIHLHGTATHTNDAAEDKAVVNVFGAQMPCSSTKGWTGHTLGAAGINNAIFSCISILENFIPVTLNTTQQDPSLSANIMLASQEQSVNRVISNAFGFGGSNCSLIFGSVD